MSKAVTMNFAVTLLAVLVLAAPEPVQVRTPRSAWSGNAFGVRWGMGPGDVERIYPRLRVFTKRSWPHEPGPITIWRTESQLTHRQVQLSFWFHKNRLYRIYVQPLGSDGWDYRAAGFNYTQDEWRQWSVILRGELREKYGEPSRKPDPLLPAEEVLEWTLAHTRIVLFYGVADDLTTRVPEIQYIDSVGGPNADRAYMDWVDRFMKEQETKERERL